MKEYLHCAWERRLDIFYLYLEMMTDHRSRVQAAIVLDGGGRGLYSPLAHKQNNVYIRGRCSPTI